ncbi:MAG: LytTR family DNA-binding domain-containing protein [Chitinophagaceae bacterium]
MELQLGTQGFLRIHKSFIVALNNINAFTAETIEISSRQLPVGNSYKKMVMAALER